MKAKLTIDDIATLKQAQIMSMGISTLVIVICSIGLSIGLYVVIKTKANIDHWGYIIFIATALVILSTIKRILDFQIDIRNGNKLVVFSDCRKLTKSSDTVSHHLLIKEYGEIDLFNYNYHYYFSFFSEKFEPYEIHLAPKSKVILFAKKLNS